MRPRCAALLCIVALSACSQGPTSEPRKDHGPRDGEGDAEKTARKRAKPLNRGECPPELLPPQLTCGKTGEDASFARGVDCWLGPCMGELVRVPEGTVQLIGPDGRAVPGRLAHDEHVLQFHPDRELGDGVYTLVLLPEKIELSNAARAGFVNLQPDDKAAKFCFRATEEPARRNGSPTHGCE